MKKILSVRLCACLCITVTACSGASNSSEAENIVSESNSEDSRQSENTPDISVTDPKKFEK